MWNIVAKIYNVASVPDTAIKDTLAEGFHNVLETAFLLFNRMKGNVWHGWD